MIYRIAVNNTEYGYVVIKANSEQEAFGSVSSAIETGNFIANDNEIQIVSVDEVVADSEYFAKDVYDATNLK
jgi:hypothetical protein